MKILFILLTLLMFNKDCNQKNSVDTTTLIQPERMSEKSQQYTKVWYEASTRGFYEKIWITKDSITITNDRNHMENLKYETSENDWKELLRLLEKIDLDKLPNLEAPTSKSDYDGAAFATLAIEKNKTEIKSNSFDHGHPPKLIEDLVNKVLSMKEKYQKN